EPDSPTAGDAPTPAAPSVVDPALLEKLAEADRTLVGLRTELANADASREAQRSEMVELRQRAERQQAAGETENKRLGTELVAEKGRNLELEKFLGAARLDVKSRDDELAQLRGAEAKVGDAKTIQSLKDEVQSLTPFKAKVAALT